MIERIASGRTDLVFDFLAAGHAANATDSGDVSLLKWCAYYGDVSALKMLLEHGECLESLGENFDLNGAAFHGHWRLCRFLLESGASASFATRGNGETALHAVCSSANRPDFEPVVSVLLEAGADPNAHSKPNEDTGCFMRDARTKGETPLHRAAAFSTMGTIERLLDAGASREERDMTGDTPLSWASWHLRPDAILRLLCYGEHRIHAERDSQADHGRGTSAMEIYLRGKPL